MRSKTQWIIGGILLAIGAAALSVYAGMSDTGTIDVDQKIESTDRSNYTVPVNTNTRATVPNGGLRGKGKAAEPAPAPVEEEQAGATTTEDGETSADSGEAADSAPEEASSAEAETADSAGDPQPI